MLHSIPIHHRPRYIGSSQVAQDQLMARFDAILPENDIPPYVDAWLDVCYSPELGLYVAIDESGVYDEATDTAYLVLTSRDGRTWDRVETPVWYSEGGRLSWSPELGLFCFVGYLQDSSWTEYQSMVSADGITWVVGTPGAYSFTPKGVAWSPVLAKFFAVDGGNTVRSSPDGLVWSTAATLPTTHYLEDLIWTDIRGDGGSFCASGSLQVWAMGELLSSGGMLFGSDPETGTIWSALFEEFFTGHLTGLAESDDGEVIAAVGEGDILVYDYASKPAAATFTLQSYPVGYPPAGVPKIARSWALETWIIVGLDRFLVSYAEDATVWAIDTPVVPPPGGDFRSVCAGGDIFLACGYDAGGGAPGVVVSN